MGNPNEAHDMAVIVGIGAERAGMNVTDRDNPSMSELAREARRLGVNLCSLFAAAGSTVR